MLVDTVARLFSSCAKVLHANPSVQDAHDLARLQSLVDKGILLPMMGNTHGFEEVYFFQVDETLDGDGAWVKYRSLGLEPVDWQSLVWLNEKDSSLAKSHPNGTQWPSLQGRWQFIAFTDLGEGCRVRGDWVDYWLPGWWLAGRPIKWTTY